MNLDGVGLKMQVGLEFADLFFSNPITDYMYVKKSNNEVITSANGWLRYKTWNDGSWSKV